MTKHSALNHDQEEPKRQSSAKRQVKEALIKKKDKKPARQKTTITKSVAIENPVMMNNPSTHGNVDPRIAERAYELHHHRGGHHGQDLEDWLVAEREVLSEESCSS